MTRHVITVTDNSVHLQVERNMAALHAAGGASGSGQRPGGSAAAHAKPHAASGGAGGGGGYSETPHSAQGLAVKLDLECGTPHPHGKLFEAYKRPTRLEFLGIF